MEELINFAFRPIYSEMTFFLYTLYWQSRAPACLCEADCIDTLFGYTIDSTGVPKM
jgi:hypothetical protein